MRDQGFNVMLGLRRGSSWEKAVKDGWVEGENLFEIAEAVQRGTIIQFLLSDAGQIQAWPTVKENLNEDNALYFSHGFGIVFHEDTGIIPPDNVDVILVAPKGSGLTVRTHFQAGRGINSSFAISCLTYRLSPEIKFKPDSHFSSALAIVDELETKAAALELVVVISPSI